MVAALGSSWLAPILFFLLVGKTFCAEDLHNEHDEHHTHEPASFKYSRQANEPYDDKMPEKTAPDAVLDRGGRGSSKDPSHGAAKARSAHGHSHDNDELPRKPAPQHHNQHHDNFQGDHGHTHMPSDHGHVHSHVHSHGDNSHGQRARSSDSEKKTSSGHHEAGRDLGLEKPAKQVVSWLWLKALGATLFISVIPVFILLLIPVDSATVANQPSLKVLLSFASGGLLGDAFLHLIPHAVSPHNHSEGHGHSHSEEGSIGHAHSLGDHSMSVGLWVLAGIVAFLVVEKLVRLAKGEHSHSHSHSSTSKLHSHDKVVSKNKGSTNSKTQASDNSSAKTEGDALPTTAGETEGHDGKSHRDDASPNLKSECHGGGTPNGANPVRNAEHLKIAGYLNLAADFAHNFTDGMAIGASFLAGDTIGLITTATMLLHEVPHEVGDFAILLQSGCSKKKAILLQFSTAVGAMCGTMLSLLAEGLGQQATLWILPFTAGGFIYIATVSVIPELLEDTKFWQSVKEIGALLLGVYMMVVIAQYE